MNTYLKYVKDVLGIKDFIRPNSEVVASALPRICFLLEKTLNSEEQDLLLKMIAAMKINQSDYTIQVAPVQNEHWRDEISQVLSTCKYLISFSEKLSEQLAIWLKQKNLQIPIISTHGPAALLKNPQLKKQTWNDLQLVMKSIG